MYGKEPYSFLTVFSNCCYNTVVLSNIHTPYIYIYPGIGRCYSCLYIVYRYRDSFVN